MIPFKVYLEDGKVRRKTPDPEKAKALFQKAEKRLKYICEINEENASFILENAYEIIRETIQALMSIRGFKPYSHKAMVSYLSEYFQDEFKEHQIREFDRFRKLRNNSVYGAESVSVEEAEECLELSCSYVNKVKEILCS